MPVFLVLLFAIRPPSNVRAESDSRAKVVEDYVVSANLDEKTFPQLHQRSQLRELYRNDGTNAPAKARDTSLSSPLTLPLSLTHTPRNTIDPAHHLIDDAQDALQDRDLLLHHHHLLPPHPPPHPPPPPPPPHPHPVGLLYAPSFFAIGLITFLLLLNSLQTSLLLVLKSKGSLLGSVTGALGRRKRFALEDDSEFRRATINFKRLPRR